MIRKISEVFRHCAKMKTQNNQTLRDWLENNNISLKEFEKISKVPYQRISEHIRLNKPLSEKHVVMILEVTDCKVAPESLRPSVKPIFELMNKKNEGGGPKMKQEMKWFAFGLAIIIGIFAITIFKGPTEEVTEVAVLESQHHYEEAQKALNESDLDLALAHLDAIDERTPAWFESRELHWKVKEDINMYARQQQEAQAVQ